MTNLPQKEWYPKHDTSKPVDPSKLNQHLRVLTDGMVDAQTAIRALNALVNLTQVLNEVPGPLPLSGSFVCHGGVVLLISAGSGFESTGGAALFTMNVFLDGNQVGTSRMYANTQNNHLAMVPSLLVLHPAAGTHTVKLAAGTNMVSDSNDTYSVVAVEMPL